MLGHEVSLIQAVVEGGIGVALIVVVWMFLKDRAEDRRDRAEERKDRAEERTVFMQTLHDFNETFGEMVAQCRRENPR